MSAPDRPPFFVGWSNAVPRPLALFALAAAAVFIGAMAGLAFSLSASVEDPGDARFLFAEGQQSFTGMVRLDPYPVLHVPASENDGPRALLLSGPGKRGAHDRVAELAGAPVTIRGIVLRRGDIDMIQVSGAEAASAGEGASAFEPAAAEPLGRWRLTGEICDGKCAQGAMRPGRGLAHKACANLCLIGGAPPVFVTASPVAGHDYFLLADADGGPLPEQMLDLVALTLEVEGRVERRDDLAVFMIDLDTARVP